MSSNPDTVEVGQVKAWTRWQNWVGVVVGLYAAASALWLPPDAMANGSLMIGGILIVVAAVLALGTPIIWLAEWVQTLLGAALVLSPWVFQYAHILPSALTAWLCGLIAAATGLWAALSVQQLRREHPPTPTQRVKRVPS